MIVWLVLNSVCSESAGNKVLRFIQLNFITKRFHEAEVLPPSETFAPFDPKICHRSLEGLLFQLYLLYFCSYSNPFILF